MTESKMITLNVVIAPALDPEVRYELQKLVVQTVEGAEDIGGGTSFGDDGGDSDFATELPRTLSDEELASVEQTLRAALSANGIEPTELMVRCTTVD